MPSKPLNFRMNYLVAFGIFSIGNLYVYIIRLNRGFYDLLFNSILVSTHQGYGECFFSKLRGGVSEILKHPLIINLSFALIKNICNLVFN